jgi:hypothetical protein
LCGAVCRPPPKKPKHKWKISTALPQADLPTAKLRN